MFSWIKHDPRHRDIVFCLFMRKAYWVILGCSWCILYFFKRKRIGLLLLMRKAYWTILQYAIDWVSVTAKGTQLLLLAMNLYLLIPSLF